MSMPAARFSVDDRQVADRADAGGAHGDPPRRRLRRRDQVGEAPPGPAGVHHQQHRAGRDPRHRREVAQRVEGHGAAEEELVGRQDRRRRRAAACGRPSAPSRRRRRRCCRRRRRGSRPRSSGRSSGGSISASRRAVRSTAPPGGKGTTRRIGRSGKASCARSGARHGERERRGEKAAAWRHGAASPCGGWGQALHPGASAATLRA